MFQATNPPTLKLKLKFAGDDVSFGSESTSECENVKKERSGAEDTVFDVKEKIKPEKTKDCVMQLLAELLVQLRLS